jgi:3-methyl-2-oxobutanoate hydroxymethyltransferase
MMIAHGAAVKRGSKRACLVVDMPFGSYQESIEQAFRNAVRVMRETGCSAVKMEGGKDLAPTVEFLVKRGIPVMGHVGLMPQQINTLGSYRARGRANDEAAGVMADAIAIAEAGAFSVVVEGVLEQVAQAITARIAAPTIGIGASADCDGQVLVAEDMLGLFGAYKPRFVKRYAELAGEIDTAAASYAADVRGRRFPGPENVFGSLKKSS